MMNASVPTFDKPLRTRMGSGNLQGLIRRILLEPATHFLALGALIFAISHYSDQRHRLEHIVITKGEVARIAEAYRLQYGQTPTSSQLEGLIRNFVDEEISYREALKLGLDRGDDIVRRRLIQKYEFVQQDLTIPSAPTEVQLRIFYRDHIEKYQIPARITFIHVYFSSNQLGERAARDAAEATAYRLNMKRITDGTTQENRLPAANTYVEKSSAQLARDFGEEGLAHDIFNVETHHWSVPLKSKFGWHTVYVIAHQSSRQMAFGDVTEDVRRDYIDAERKRGNAEAFEKLRQQFKITRE